MLKPLSRLLLACSFALIFCSASANGDAIRTVALTGESASGVTDGATYKAFSYPLLNEMGQIAFVGSLTGPNVTPANDSGIWVQRHESGPALVARTGEVAPSEPSGAVFSSFSSFTGPYGFLTLNDAGQVSFRGQLTRPGINLLVQDAIWSERSGGSLSLIAQEKNTAPGTSPGTRYSGVSDPVSNSAGEVAYRGNVSGPDSIGGANFGIWLSKPNGQTSLVTGSGESAPDTEPGVEISVVTDVLLNDSGHLVFKGFLSGPFINSGNQQGIWAGKPDTGLRSVARQGEQAQGTNSGVTYSNLSDFSINNASQVVFRASLRGSEIVSSNNGGIWSEGRGTGLELIVREGDNAPGTSASTRFSVLGEPRINGLGQTAFRGVVAGPGVSVDNNDGIWKEQGNLLTLIVREGSNAPGTDAGVNFSFLGTPAFNDSGQVAFLGVLDGADVTSENDRGIWAEDTSGALTLIAREGDLLNVSDAPGQIDLRTIETLEFASRASSEDGRGQGFNNLGQIVFASTFTDGTSGVFVSNLVLNVPEPSSAMLLFAAVMMINQRSRGAFSHLQGI